MLQHSILIMQSNHSDLLGQRRVVQDEGGAQMTASSRPMSRSAAGTRRIMSEGMLPDPRQSSTSPNLSFRSIRYLWLQLKSSNELMVLFRRFLGRSIFATLLVFPVFHWRRDRHNRIGRTTQRWPPKAEEDPCNNGQQQSPVFTKTRECSWQ